jgi:hypothetical protein
VNQVEGKFNSIYRCHNGSKGAGVIRGDVQFYILVLSRVRRLLD